MYEYNLSEYKSVDFINNCGFWCLFYLFYDIVILYKI